MAPGRQAAGGCRQGGTTTHYLAPSARPRQWGLQPLLRRPRHETAVGTTTPAKLFVPGSCLNLTCTVRARLRFAGPPAPTMMPEGPFKGFGNSPPDGTGSLQSLAFKRVFDIIGFLWLPWLPLACKNYVCDLTGDVQRRGARHHRMHSGRPRRPTFMHPVAHPHPCTPPVLSRVPAALQPHPERAHDAVP